MNGRQSLIAHPQVAELVEPSDGSLDHPACLAQAAAMLVTTLGDQAVDALGLQVDTNLLQVISPVGLNAALPSLRAPARAVQSAQCHQSAAEIELVRTAQFVQQHKLQVRPHAGLLPSMQASPAGHARTATHFLRQHLPWNPRLQHEQNAHRYPSIVQALSTRVSLAPPLDQQ